MSQTSRSTICSKAHRMLSAFVLIASETEVTSLSPVLFPVAPCCFEHHPMSAWDLGPSSDTAQPDRERVVKRSPP